MATAVVIVNRQTGAGPANSNITTINTVANASDAHQTTAASSTNPIKVPTSGSNYSYWVVTRLETTTGPAGTINNLRWHTDGANNFGTGVTCISGTAAGYTQATGTLGETGTQLTTMSYTGLSGLADCFSRTSGSPLSVIGSTTGIEQFGERIIYQLVVGNTAGAGVTGQETFTWLYDET